MILCSNPKSQYLAHKNEIDAAIAGVLEKGRYILGEEVEKFQKEFADYIGVKHAVGVGSGTEALHLALKAIGVGQGDEVITVSHTAVATIAGIECAGARPVFVDIEQDYYTMDPDKIEDALTPHTRAIIPVHIYGQPADMNPIKEIAVRHNLRIIEDCAQAHGAKYFSKRIGSIGDIGCFSFYPTKNLGAIGDGGMVVSNNDIFAEKANSLRQYGWNEKRICDSRGWNSRLDEIQAAILRVKLPFLDKDNNSRNGIAQMYQKGLSGIPCQLPGIRPDSSHVFHLYVIRTKNRDGLKKHLAENGILSGIHYTVPVHFQPTYIGLMPNGNKLDNTENISGEILSLPIYPELEMAEAEKVIETVSSFSF
ncbi:MAG: DegT/DnrJ/EryC1/StrS family aminotransferase [bacterium]